ncbi:MAG: hypothetical protein RBG13Loki_1206 [Promethearchaeota archaeon CR_4]|nr:MAG: hypothetical protein RBG13Loki_1206 [Candidatus Lokiarchaeota archaeon CR_4]
MSKRDESGDKNGEQPLEEEAKGTNEEDIDNADEEPLEEVVPEGEEPLELVEVVPTEEQPEPAEDVPETSREELVGEEVPEEEIPLESTEEDPTGEKISQGNEIAEQATNEINPEVPVTQAPDGGTQPVIVEGSQEPMIIVIGLSKAGSLTVPKDVRDALKLDPGKKFKFTWDRANKLLFEIVPDNEIIEIEQRIEAEKEKKTKKTEAKKPKKGKVAGPEFEFGKYLGYEFDGSAKLQPILEKSFDQFRLEPPNIEEGLKYVKFAIISLTGENNIVNSKLRFTLVNFLCDVVEKFNQPFLLDYTTQNILKDIKSKFLFEQSLVQIAVTSFRKRPEKVPPLVQMILKNIDDYPAIEIYNVINSFELLSKRMSEAKFAPEITKTLRDKIMEKIPLMADRDYKMQAIRQLSRLRYFEDAIKICKEILAAFTENESGISEVQDLLKEVEEAARPEERKWKSEEEMDVLDVSKLSKTGKKEDKGEEE